MLKFEDSIPLTCYWKHELIRSSAAFFAFADMQGLNPDLAEEAQTRLCLAAEEFHLDPDQLQRAMCEHDPDLEPWTNGPISEISEPVR